QEGVRRGDRLIVQLPNLVAIWEIMLATLKLGAVVISAATLLTVADLRDRLHRGKARHGITPSGLTEKLARRDGVFTRILVGAEEKGWIHSAQDHEQGSIFPPVGEPNAADPSMLYF